MCDRNVSVYIIIIIPGIKTKNIIYPRLNDYICLLARNAKLFLYKYIYNEQFLCGCISVIIP